VWSWQTATGWTRIPGSEGSAPNGLEISRDGHWLYIAGWSQEKLTRISLGETPVQTEVIDLGFRPDNVRMSLDGSVIFAAGHTDKDGRSITDPREPLRETTNVAAIDPETLEFRRIFEHPAMDGFVASTTAMRIGDEMWLGSYRGDRIAYFPAPE
jgi:sugar lactone lactonase YvrE